MYLSGQGALGSSGSDDMAMLSCGAGAEVGSFRALFTILPGGFFSAGVVGAAAGAAVVLKSKAVPGVLGVLLAEPNEAKAPEPRPKAEEPPVVGDARAPGVKGEMALKGLRPPCEEVSPPKRFAVAENVRVGGWSDGASDGAVDNESLLVLQGAVSRVLWRCGERRRGAEGEAAGSGRTYLERRVQRFSLLSIGGGVRVKASVWSWVGRMGGHAAQQS